ncbi:MAG TPA: hypothetical protein VHF69_10915 [Candidatus Synoicihabitans sp.]|nr:hypothetical protein [Candidatus Synoicihabitans sp.]
MRLSPTLVIFALATSTIACATLAWQQYRRAEALAARLDRPVEAAAVQAGSVKSGGNETTVAADDTNPEETTRVESPRENRPNSPERREVRRDPAARINALMEQPEFAAAFQLQQKARLDERYASLFRKLNLPPAQLEQLKNLLADREAARMDVMSAARAEGLTGRESRDQLRELVQMTQEEVNASIGETLGDHVLNELQRYDRTAAERGTISQVERRLSYSGAPLSAAQSEALVNILATTGASRGGGAETSATGAVFAIAGGTVAGRIGGAMITDAVIAQAQGILTPAQLDALRAVQAEQEAQQRISEITRREFERNRGAPPTPPGG